MTDITELMENDVLKISNLAFTLEWQYASHCKKKIKKIKKNKIQLSLQFDGALIP